MEIITGAVQGGKRGRGLKCDDKKVLVMSYLLFESLNRKELLKMIILLIGEYFRESEDKE